MDLHRLRAYYTTAEPHTTVDMLPFTHEGTAPTGYRWTEILACTVETFRPAPPVAGLEFIILTQQSPLTDIQEGLDANARGFDPAAPAATEAEALAFRAGLTTNCAFTARLNQQPVAAGMFMPPINGVTELMGITTLADYRQRGIAAALTSELVRVAFAHAADLPILRTDNPVAYRVYQRLGFVPAAILVSTEKPDSSAA